MYYIESFNSDFDFFPLDCHAALGIADGTIPDDKMSASSILSVNDKAHLGRLNFGGAWSAAVNDVNQYLGIDLGEDFTVTGIETQGSSDKATWVTKYTLQYKTASDHPSYYTEIMQGQERMKVNSLNGYLSIIMTIYTTQPARCNESIQLGSMISLIGTRAIVGRTFSFFPSNVGRNIGQTDHEMKKKHCSTTLGGKKGRTGENRPRLSVLQFDCGS